MKDQGKYKGMTVSLWCLIVLDYFLLFPKRVFVSGRRSDTVLTRNRNNVLITERKRNTGAKCTSLYFFLIVSPALLILSPDVPRVNREQENRCFQRSPNANFSNESVVTVRF